MATLATVALKCAKQLGRVNAAGDTITDLETEIKEEIGEAITFYNRKPWHLTEVRNITLTTVASTIWYSTVDVSTGAGDQSVSGRSSVDVNSILSIDYLRENASSITDDLRRFDYRSFEQLQEGSPPGGVPYGYTMYAGQIGIYPTPDQAYTLTFSAHVKPVVPTSDSDTSVWFDEAEELIVAGAIKRVLLKYIRDAERAGTYVAIERDAMEQLHAEHIRKTATSRIKAHD
jgi:hypothetical protein